MKILIVDDSHTSAICLKAFVKEVFNKPEITVCYSFNDASEAIKANEFDVAFLDYNLHRPDKTGADLAAMLPSCWKIIVSGFDMNGPDYEACEKAGIDAYIQKPIDRAKLRNGVSLIKEPRSSIMDAIGTGFAIAILFVLAGIEALAYGVNK